MKLGTNDLWEIWERLTRPLLQFATRGTGYLVRKMEIRVFWLFSRVFEAMKGSERSKFPSGVTEDLLG